VERFSRNGVPLAQILNRLLNLKLFLASLQTTPYLMGRMTAPQTDGARPAGRLLAGGLERALMIALVPEMACNAK